MTQAVLVNCLYDTILKVMHWNVIVEAVFQAKTTA